MEDVGETRPTTKDYTQTALVPGLTADDGDVGAVRGLLEHCDEIPTEVVGMDTDALDNVLGSCTPEWMVAAIGSIHAAIDTLGVVMDRAAYVVGAGPLGRHAQSASDSLYAAAGDLEQLAARLARGER